jgi:reversibly glycosylated polypeptide / UDP-arabinopyranose mutase
MVDIAVVVPTIREECIQRWLVEWGNQLAFTDTQVIVVEDNPEPIIKGLPGSFDHYSWKDIDHELGSESWIIPRRTSAIKAYGFLKAYQGGADIIWTLDDDCYPEQGRIDYLDNIEDLLYREYPQEYWWSTLFEDLYPRGYPYGIRNQERPVMVHHGLWSNIPDLDGLTQKNNPDFRTQPSRFINLVPRGQFFPMCGMNLAWRREMTPAMYFMLMGEDKKGIPWGFDRFDDMFAGLFVKKIADHLNYAITSGSPSIHHAKASDVESNIHKEASGIIAYEELWQEVEKWNLTADTVKGCYLQLAMHVRDLQIETDPSGYWLNLAYAMAIWSDLF